MAKNEAVFTKDTANKKITVVRGFDAPVDQVWKAWTESEILDQWWAPKPYKAETKRMDFREGGSWLYAMVGPEGDKQYCLINYKTIDKLKSFTAFDAFCDEEGNKNNDFPSMDWKNAFKGSGNNTTVTIEITFAKPADMDAILKMGFEEGFGMGLNNLDDYLANK